jgi:hypothetical protein
MQTGPSLSQPLHRRRAIDFGAIRGSYDLFVKPWIDPVRGMSRGFVYRTGFAIGRWPVAEAFR